MLVISTITHSDVTTKNMTAMKAATPMYMLNMVVMRALISSATLNFGINPRKQASPHKPSIATLDSHNTQRTALLQATNHRNADVCRLSRLTLKCLPSWPAAPTDHLDILDLISQTPSETRSNLTLFLVPHLLSQQPRYGKNSWEPQLLLIICNKMRHN